MDNDDNKTVPWAIVLYVRLSDEDRKKTEEEKSASIKNQIKYLELYIEGMRARGENITAYIVRYDDGKTGTDTNRSGFQEVVELLVHGGYNCLLVVDLSRGFRNISDQTYYLEEFFPLHNIRFISTTLQYVDSYLMPESSMNLGVKFQGISNEQFAYDTSVKIRSRFDAKRRLGEFIGAFAPYGYEKHPENNDLLIIDPEAARIVSNIFHWFVTDHMSLSGIAKKLNANAIVNPTKYKNQKGLRLSRRSSNDGLWGASSVRYILTNEVYLGKMVQGKQKVVNYKVHKSKSIPKSQWYIVDNTHHPIIEQDIFDQAQYLLSLNIRAGQGQRVYPLSGLLKCGRCKKAMTRKTSGSLAYYSCRTRKDKGTQFCTPHSIREEKLFQAVLEAIHYQVLQLEGPQLLLQRVNALPAPSTSPFPSESQLNYLMQGLAQEKKVFDNCYYDLQQGLLSREQFMRIRHASEHRQNVLEAQIEDVRHNLSELLQQKERKQSYHEIFLKSGGAAELTRSLAVDLIDAVFVNSNGSLEIYFNFAGPQIVP